MAVRIVPTLETMVEIYSLSGAGGGRSDRFTTYVNACREGALLHGFNPMTKQPVAPVLEGLLALGAERVILEAGRETLDRLGVDDDVELFISVATPGMWTDRRATTIDHRIAPRHVGELLLWFDDELSETSIRAAAIEQTVRAVWWRQRSGDEPTLNDVAGREGLAGVLAGRPGAVSQAAAEALEVLGSDASRASAVAYLFGDAAAEHLGYPSLDLEQDEGWDHSIAQATQSRAT